MEKECKLIKNEENTEQGKGEENGENRSEGKYLHC